MNHCQTTASKSHVSMLNKEEARSISYSKKKKNKTHSISRSTTEMWLRTQMNIKNGNRLAAVNFLCARLAFKWCFIIGRRTIHKPIQTQIQIYIIHLVFNIKRAT